MCLLAFDYTILVCPFLIFIPTWMLYSSTMWALEGRWKRSWRTTARTTSKIECRQSSARWAINSLLVHCALLCPNKPGFCGQFRCRRHRRRSRGRRFSCKTYYRSTFSYMFEYQIGKDARLLSRIELLQLVVVVGAVAVAVAVEESFRTITKLNPSSGRACSPVSLKLANVGTLLPRLRFLMVAHHL